MKKKFITFCSVLLSALARFPAAEAIPLKRLPEDSVAADITVDKEACPR